MPTYRLLKLSRLLILVMMVLTIILMPMSTFAQDPNESLWWTYASPDGSFSFEYPDLWAMRVGYLYLLTDGGNVDDIWDIGTTKDEVSVIVIVVPPSGFDLMYYGDNEGLPQTPHDFLEFRLFEFSSETNFIDIEEGTFSDYPAVIANFDGTTFGQLVVMDMGDEGRAAVVGYTYADEYEPYQETVELIADSLTFHDYQPGEFRTIMSQDLNISLEIPAEFFHDGFAEENVLLISSGEEGIGSYGVDVPLIAIAGETFYIEESDTTSDQFQSPELALETVVGVIEDDYLTNPTLSDVETISIEDAPVDEILKFTFESEEFDRMIFAFELTDGRVMTAVILGNDLVDATDFEAIVVQIISTIQSRDNNAELADD